MALASHLFTCASAVLNVNTLASNSISSTSATVTTTSSLDSTDSVTTITTSTASITVEEPKSPKKASKKGAKDEDQKTTKSVGSPKKRKIPNDDSDKDDGDEEEEDANGSDEETSSSASPKGKKGKSDKMTEAEYDEFLRTVKSGRFKRVGKWAGYGTGTQHECCDVVCGRQWKPSPKQCEPDDYYCPSCVLHHRNNMGRFEEPRLAWTAVVPNTFYVFSLVDPKTKKKLTKFGRTQHADAWKRYPAKEVRDYKMEMILSLRGKLITMTRIENWWKEHAEENSLFSRFSDPNFHGLSECLSLDEQKLKFMLDKSHEIHKNNV